MIKIMLLILTNQVIAEVIATTLLLLPFGLNLIHVFPLPR
jgi:hypothetical protein